MRCKKVMILSLDNKTGKGKMISLFAVTTVIFILCVCSVITVGCRALNVPFFSKVQANPLSQLQHQAHTAYDNGRYFQALSLLKQALQLDPNNPRLLTNLGAAENEVSNFTGPLLYLKIDLQGRVDS
jgi:tetratricopeptide (TPR) repeat protein